MDDIEAIRKKVVKTPKDVTHIIKASIPLCGAGQARKVCLRGQVFFVEFDADVVRFTRLGPVMVLAAYILNLMMTCYGYLKEFEDKLSSVEVLCWVGKDSHRVRTPMRILRRIHEKTDGRLENITDITVREWVMDSVYKRVEE